MRSSYSRAGPCSMFGLKAASTASEAKLWRSLIPQLGTNCWRMSTLMMLPCMKCQR
jgi:hypothetical protein